MAPFGGLFGLFRGRPARRFVKMEAKQSSILGTVDQNYELSPLDLYGIIFTSIPVVVFYKNDINGDTLKEALGKIAEAYPVVCGRLKSKYKRRAEIVVTKQSGFQFIEENIDKNLTEAVADCRVTEQSTPFPCFAQLPWMVAPLSPLDALDKDGPLLVIKLTHLNDGSCCLGVTVHHCVADGQRLAELIVDISSAYRGEQLREVVHDRSHGWPDSMVTKIPIGIDKSHFPKKISTLVDPLPYATCPDESFSVESLYFPMRSVEHLKQNISSKLPEGELVSTIDVIVAVLWMLAGEWAAVRNGRTEPVKTISDLGLHQSFFMYLVDIAANESPLFPRNYFGNAIAGSLAGFPAAESEEEKMLDLEDTAMAVASTMRKQITQIKVPAGRVMTSIATYKALSEPPQYPAPFAGCSSYYRFPFDKMDFGEGAPVFNYGLPAYPFADIFGTICPTHNNKGVLIQKVIRTADKAVTLNSNVLKQLMPGFKMLSNLKNGEIRRLLEL